MKKQYLACEDYTPGNVPYTSMGRVIKKFKHESEAVDFVTSDKNVQQYNGLSLYLTDQNGCIFRWDGRGKWEAFA